MDITETKDVVLLGISLGNALGKSLEDGEFNWTDAIGFIPALTKVPAAISGISQVKNEIMDMDPQEKQELKSMVIDEFDIPQEKTEEIIEASIAAVLELVKIMQITK